MSELAVLRDYSKLRYAPDNRGAQDCSRGLCFNDWTGLSVDGKMMKCANCDRTTPSAELRSMDIDIDGDRDSKEAEYLGGP